MPDQAIKKFKIFSLSANKPLAEAVADGLGVELGKVKIDRFSDEEILISVEESIRGQNVYIIQPTGYPVNTHYMELFIMVDALRRASVNTINVVMPYYGYARQDRTATPREPISAKVVANLLEKTGVDHLLTLDLHTPQLQGFYSIPVENLTAAPVLANHFAENYLKEDIGVVVAPDHASATRTREYADLFDLPLAIMDRRLVERSYNAPEQINQHVIGDVKGKQCIIVDDLVDTGRTMREVSDALMNGGAEEVYALATHPVLSEKATEVIEDSPIKKIIVTDSLYIPEEKRSPKIEQISVASLLEDGIKRINDYHSLRPLYNRSYVKDLNNM